jgi:predicted esterase
MNALGVFQSLLVRVATLVGPNLAGEFRHSGPAKAILVHRFLAIPLLAILLFCCNLRAAEEQAVTIADGPISGHIHPSICRTVEGTLVVVYRGTDILMCSRSMNDGETWSTPVPIATSAKRPDGIREVKKFEIYPGTVDTLPDKRLLLTWNYIADDKATDGYYERALLYSLSSDQGLTWSDQKLIGPIDGKHLGAVRHNVLPWSEGRWLLPLRSGPPRLFDPETGKLTVFPIIGPDGKQHEFQQIVRTAKGSLLAMGPVLLNSQDKGKTWTTIENFPAVPDKRDNAEGRYLTTLSDGRVLVTWGIGQDNKGLRYHLSADGDKTWDKDRTVILLPDTNVAARYYSARTVQLDDRHVGTVFMNRDGIHFLKVNLDRLLAAESRAPDGIDIVFTTDCDGSEQRYAQVLPVDFEPGKPVDILIALHGHGSDRWQFVRSDRPECRAVRDVARNHGMILISPDYRAKTSWMGPDAEADLVQIIGDLKQQFKVRRVFLSGASMGGASSLTFAALHPDLIAGVSAMNGTANHVEYDRFQDAISESFGGSKSEIPQEYQKRSAELWPDRFTMPVAVTTGGKDKSVPPQSVQRLVEKLKKSGRKVLSIHRQAGGHSTTYEDAVAALEFILREADLAEKESLTLLNATRHLEARLAALNSPSSDLLADAEVFHKAAEWALRYDTPLLPKDIILLTTALERGTERAELLEENQTPWTTKKGKVLRGFVSSIDGSTQPYGVIVPLSYDGTSPMRLDVVLHGSSKPVGTSELRFGARFDEGNENGKSAPDVNFIELHPLGRVENCYRWAGETDVFEAIEAVCRNYRIDRDRIVLRGMSMGASGTWHLGLKHPDRFVAIGPYCGYVDTHRFSETPIPKFIKVGPLPPHQELGLHMLDSVDYAANAGVVPAIAAIGDKDVFFQAHVLMGEAFSREGLEMVNLISPGTGHKIDPVTHAEQMRRIGEYAVEGLDHAPKQIRFVTWTLKYHRCHWLELLGLEKHYHRAEFKGSVADDGGVEITEVRNITQFAIHRPLPRMRILGDDIPLPAHKADDALVFVKTNGTWQCAGLRDQIALTGKRPDLQGPIDDAFAMPFLCVRGTGKSWNPETAAWADANLRRFEYEWARYMRGDLPVKNDTEVTAADVREKHLILFGDPGSNSWIAKTLSKLPLSWTRKEVRLGGEAYPSKDHVPAFICASPLDSGRYLVINSGHTFHEKEFAAFNYLLFPRHGDWAVIKASSDADKWQPSSPAFPEEVVRAGYFDEDWQWAEEARP